MSVTSKPVSEAASAARPGPAAVRGNDWRRVAVPAPAAFRPALPISVIVPCFEAPGALALTLAGLEGQDYPRALFEVVVVDDGSRPPLRVPASTALPVRAVRQERRGFGLARARNAGARAALHDRVGAQFRLGPRFQPPSLKFRTSGFPRYGFKLQAPRSSARSLPQGRRGQGRSRHTPERTLRLLRPSTMPLAG